MQKLYESSTAPEAHSVRILLESKGIQSRIDGEHLPSGAGILPATRLVRIMVEEADYIAASEIIDAWESERKTESKARDENSALKPIVWFTYFLYSICYFHVAAFGSILSKRTRASHSSSSG